MLKWYNFICVLSVDIEEVQIRQGVLKIQELPALFKLRNIPPTCGKFVAKWVKQIPQTAWLWDL